MSESENLGSGFRRRAPADAAPLDYQLVRVPPAGRIGGICLSSDLLCRDIHHYGGRSMPCVGAGCPACRDASRLEWKGWIAIYSHTTRTTKILELTKRAMLPLEEWYKEHRTLRGALVITARCGSKANGPLFSTVSPGPIERDLLPRAPDLIALLGRMWRGSLPTHVRDLVVKIADIGSENRGAG